MKDDSPIRVFVAHLFSPQADYLRVFEYFECVDNFRYINMSSVDAVPAGGGKEALKEELRNQIRNAEIMVLPVSIYEANKDLVGFQMDVAGAFDKPILGIRSFGETVVIPQAVLGRVADVVEWNERTLVDAVRRHARHEETSRWDVIEFKLD